MDWAKEMPQSELRFDEPMSRHTSFQVGGPADCLLIARGGEEIARALRIASSAGEPVTVIGNGSNLLVRDGGIRGLVIKVAEGMRDIRAHGERITAQAGAPLRRVAAAALEAGLAGLEFASGIPGNVGGALSMNAGAYGFELERVIVSVRAVASDGMILDLPRDRLGFGYRTSALRDGRLIAVEAEFALEPGEREAIRALMDDYASRRASAQPLNLPSAGSTFKRPPGQYAGKLIQDAGLKGASVGGAQVSPKHAGFIVNTGGATAQDILKLIARVQEAVQAQFGILLEPEVRILGEE